MYTWTKKEIENILLQLNKMNYPFKKYAFSCIDEELVLLGSGAYANVYEAHERKNKDKTYAIKVIGIRDRQIDSKVFRESIDAQIHSGLYAVQYYDHMELKVWLDDDNQVLRVETIPWFIEDEERGDFLRLQCVVFEKLKPVLKKDKLGKEELTIPELESFDEKNILQFAYDIGNALADAHKKNILHRDVKLENVFYDEIHKCYKLGDFGIAVKTIDGMTGEKAFTKGYGAPEVVNALVEKYDQTADIYSFGMMLYVLCNDLCFPNSRNYRVNILEQYTQGYMLPPPKHGSRELYIFLAKMCHFNPDERYQSMEEVLCALEGLRYGEKEKYRRENSNLTGTMATIWALLGGWFWLFSFGMFGKLPENKWMVVLSWSLAVVFTMQFFMSKVEEIYWKKIYRIKWPIWGIAIYVYGSMVFTSMQQDMIYKLEVLFGPHIAWELATWNLGLVGWIGLGFSVLWLVREWIMMRLK